MVKKQKSIYVDPDKWKIIKKILVDKEMSFSQFVSDCIEQAIIDHNKKPKRIER
jgi:hypothetical protein